MILSYFRHLHRKQNCYSFILIKNYVKSIHFYPGDDGPYLCYWLFVAAVIKGIAFWADSLEYHHSHTAELAQFNKINKVRVKIGELLGLVPPEGTEQLNDEREDFARGENPDLTNMKPGGYYHGVSHGVSQLNLIDYYYPRDTRFMYLKKKEQIMKKRNPTKNKPLSPEE